MYIYNHNFTRFCNLSVIGPQRKAGSDKLNRYSHSLIPKVKQQSIRNVIQIISVMYVYVCFLVAIVY